MIIKVNHKQHTSVVVEEYLPSPQLSPLSVPPNYVKKEASVLGS